MACIYIYSRRCLYANQFYQPYFYIACKRILHINDIATTKYLPDPSDIFSSNMAADVELKLGLVDFNQF